MVSEYCDSRCGKLFENCKHPCIGGLRYMDKLEEELRKQLPQ